MNSAAKDIANILKDVSSLGLTLNTDLFHAKMPDGEDFINVVATYDIGGGPPKLALQKSESDYYFTNISIQVRNSDYDTGYELAFDIMEYLHGLNNIVEDGTLYTVIKAQNDPQLLGWDDNQRPVFVTSYETQRREN